ncbi:MAG: phage tail tape measure protein, partial [Culicoidibacterales bacterium]
MAGELGKASFQAVFEDGGVVKGLKGIDSQANSTVSNTGGAFSSLGGIASKALGVVSVAAIASVGTSMVNMSMDFEVSMAKINTLLGDTKNLDMYEQTIIDFSKETGLSIDNLSDGMYQTISSIGDLGAETEEIFKTMGTSAKAGGAEMSDSVALISSAMKGYGEVNDDTAQKISDLAFTTAKLGVTTFPELAKSMQPLFPLGDSLNLSYEELFGTMATLTGVTGNTSEVTTQFKAVMSGLISPTKGMEGLLEKYGYASGQAMIETEGLTGMLEILQDETGGQTDKMAELFGSTEALTAITALSGSQFDTFKDKMSEMENASGATNTAYEKMSNTLRDKLDVTMNNVKVSSMAMADTFLDKVGPSLISVLDNANALMNGTKSMGEVLDDVYAESFNFIQKLPTIIETGTNKIISGIETFTTNANELGPQFMNVAIGFLDNMIIGIVESAPGLITAIMSAMTSMLTGAIEMLPELINLGVDIGAKTIEGLVSCSFAYTEQGYIMVYNIMTGLLSAIPDLLAGVGTLFETIMTTIETQMPLFLENG